MIAALVIVCVMFALATVALAGVCYVVVGSMREQATQAREERRDLINRVIAKHGLEVAHLDRIHQPSPVEHVEREIHDQIGM